MATVALANKMARTIWALLAHAGRLHAAPALQSGDGLTTGKALADERETLRLMRDGRDRNRAMMRSWMVAPGCTRDRLPRVNGRRSS